MNFKTPSLALLSLAIAALGFSFIAAAPAPATPPASAPAALDPTLNPAGRPNTAIIPAPQDPARMERNFFPKHDANVARAKKGNIDLLFVGDSIMQGWTSTGDWGKAVWDKYYDAPYNAAVMAIGYDRTQHVLWRMQNGEGEGYQPKVVELLIGTNNIGQNTVPEIIFGERAVLDDLHKRFPGAKILTVSVFPRGSPTEQARKDVNAINEALAKMADDKSFFYIDITKTFLNDDGTVNDALKRDRLHPSAKGYQMWADAVNPSLDKLLKDSGITPKPVAASAPATMPAAK